MFSDVDLFAAVMDGELKVDPFDFSLIQPASLDLRLGSAFRTFIQAPGAFVDPGIHQPGLTNLSTLSGNEAFRLEPGDFTLGCTLETITLSRTIAARLEGKSSLGRIGLIPHAAAGWIDPGFSGQITLELSNLSPLPIILRPGMPIAQLCVFRLDNPAAVPYGPERHSRYQGQRGPTAARVKAPMS